MFLRLFPYYGRHFYRRIFIRPPDVIFDYSIHSVEPKLCLLNQIFGCPEENNLSFMVGYICVRKIKSFMIFNLRVSEMFNKYMASTSKYDLFLLQSYTYNFFYNLLTLYDKLFKVQRIIVYSIFKLYLQKAYLFIVCKSTKKKKKRKSKFTSLVFGSYWKKKKIYSNLPQL